MPALYSSPTCGSGGLYNYITQPTATACATNTVWVTTNCITACASTTSSVYWTDYNQNQSEQAQLMAYYNRRQQEMINQAFYGGNTCNQTAFIQPQISRAEQDRRNAQREQSLYEKALEEHDEQEAARLRRLIDAREQAAATQRAIDEQRRLEQVAARERQQAAEVRANDLLSEHLTPDQRKTYADNRWFVIEGGKSKTKYRIRADAGLVANVDVLDNQDRRVHRLCAHARTGSVPLGDQLLAQKIMLENAEDDFLRVANRHAA